MSDATSLPAANGAPVTMPTLTATIAHAVRTTPGVVRLEPSMKNSLNRLIAKGTGRVGGPGISAAGVDGIVVSTRDGLTTATVDIATDTAYTAVNVAVAVQHTVRELLSSHGHEPGPVSVSVLSVEPTTP